jgi:sialidase-1
MKLTEHVTIYKNPSPLLLSKQAVFPGIINLLNGDLLALFSIGQAFDSADQRGYFSKSSDNGRSWSDPKKMHNHEFKPYQLSESFKPVMLNDGTLLAIGYGFERPDDITPIVDEDTFNVLPLKNMCSRSYDNGLTWDAPSKIDIDGGSLELSGPCIQLKTGRIVGAAAPFHLGSQGHCGWLIYSDDGGLTWGKLSEFFKSSTGEIAPWECRIQQIGSGKLAVLFWAYDTKKSLNLNNFIVFSQNDGEQFSSAIDTGIAAQASNLMLLADNKIVTIHAHRDHEAGLCVRKVDISGDKFHVENELDLFTGKAIGSDLTDIRKQFGSLRFGQPGLVSLANGEALAYCWKVEDGQHIIKGYFINL